MKYPLTILLILFVFKLNAQGVLTLDEAIKIALENNYSIKIAKSNQKIAINNNTPGNAGMLPSVTGNINKNYSINGLTLQPFDATFPTIERSNVQNNNGGAGVNAVWTLYDNSTHKGFSRLTKPLKLLWKIIIPSKLPKVIRKLPSIITLLAMRECCRV